MLPTIIIVSLLSLGGLWAHNNRLKGIWAPEPFRWFWQAEKRAPGSREGTEGDLHDDVSRR